METVIQLILKGSKKFGKIIISSQSGGAVSRTEIQCNEGVKSVSTIETSTGGGYTDGNGGDGNGGDGNGGDGNGGDGNEGDTGGSGNGKKIIKTIITDKKGGKMTIVCKFSGEQISSKGEVSLSKGESGIWKASSHILLFGSLIKKIVGIGSFESRAES